MFSDSRAGKSLFEGTTSLFLVSLTLERPGVHGQLPCRRVIVQSRHAGEQKPRDQQNLPSIEKGTFYCFDNGARLAILVDAGRSRRSPFFKEDPFEPFANLRVMRPRARLLLADRSYEGALLTRLLYYGGLGAMLETACTRAMWAIHKFWSG